MLTLTRAQAELTEAYLDTLSESGLIVEPFGGGTVRVMSAPVILGRPAPELAAAMIEALEGYAEMPASQRRRDELIKLACRKSVKGGEPLTREQIAELLRGCSSAASAPTCPHGRPICVAISKRELDRRFRRIK